jgi:hypothetical protein
MVPILLITYNRPDLVRLQIERLRRIKPEKLYVASDGPKSGKSNDKILVYESREIVDKSVNWQCCIYKKFEDENLGCGKGVSDAVAWFFEHEPEGIILEDDCNVSDSFYPFCKYILEKYRSDESVAGVTADFKFISNDRPSNYYGFIDFPLIWGWATWKRVWQKYKYQLDNETDNASEIKFLNHLPRRGQKYWAKQFSSVTNNRVDTWDYQLAHLVLKNRMRFVHPMRNLVTNVGLGENATHTKCISDPTSKLQSLEVTGPYKEDTQYREYNDYLATKYFIERTLFEKVGNRIADHLKHWIK